MDVKLMRDFEELEGLGDQSEEDTLNAMADDDDLDDMLRPHSVVALNNAEVYAEVIIY